MSTNENLLMSLVEQKARLAGSNRMELLLFSLGGRETFGINVFKVREVCELKPITPTPNMPHGVEGIISLRGAIIPVINLAHCLGMELQSEHRKLIITEFSSSTQAFLVGEVDRIVRVDWEQVKTPQSTVTGGSGLVTAITELPGGRLVSILDVEQILADVMGEEEVPPLETAVHDTSRMVFFADDSAIARKKVTQVLDRMGLPHQHAVNGREALERLHQMAAQAQAEGVPLKERLGVVLVDAEMPEMDGYVLTRHIKQDPRFNGIPVVMHSSLSSVANKKLGQQVGVDAYVAKFHFQELASTIAGMLRSGGEQGSQHE
ncbi:MAG: chemotaxis protein CheV [Burkholderiales bacterium]|nr:chemotaxis protein CheV [Burkholderiales bacterium]PZN06052.1 MAG: fused signal transduction protein/response regulator [Pseudomonadota bacterium]